jgi:alpha-galactosidase
VSEYLPYFRKKDRPDLFEKFKVRQLPNFPAKQKRSQEQDIGLKGQINSDHQFPVIRTDEYCAQIIHSIETGIPLRINANVKNNNLITNLPKGCCVEVPCLVDKEGIRPCYVGDLPPQLAALNRTNINVQELAVRGIVEKDKTKIFQAILLDPLTSTILTIDETRQMVDEMFKEDKKYLKDFK